MLLWILVYNFLCACVFVFLGIPVGGSCGKSVFTVLRNCQTVFQVAAPFYFPNSRAWGFCFPWQHLFSLFLIIAILVITKWYLIVVLICISLMANDFEHQFMYLLSTCISPSEKWLFRFLPIFKLGFKNHLVRRVFLCILGTNTGFAKYFLPL